MKMLSQVLVALALACALFSPARAQTVGAAGGPINMTTIMPALPATSSCTVTALSTFTATQIVAAASSQRLYLWILNVSTLTLSQESSASNAATRPPDEWVLFSNTDFGAAGGTSSQAIPIPRLPLLPGIKLRGQSGVSTTESASAESSRILWQGYGVPQQALYAIAESTGPTVQTSAKIAVCRVEAQ